MTDQPMTIDDVIEDFGGSEHTIPRASMQWAVDNWAVAAPRFLEMLSRYVGGTDRTERTEIALLIIIHLLGEKAETAAFQDLCRLLRDQDGMETILGDAITWTLSRLLISLFDGDADTLRAVVEAADVDEFVRGAAITAVAYLTRIGRIPEADTRAWLRGLLPVMRPQEVNDVWHGWVESVSALGLAEFIPDVRRVFERGLIDTAWFTYADFEADLKLTLDDPDRMAGFAENYLAPVTSAIDELVKLDSFAEPEEVDEGWDAIEASSPARKGWSWGGGDVNPWRHVGRNDPCPCGSGRKFKKCCLGKPEAARPLPGAAPRA